jgi:hypothetical protein
MSSAIDINHDTTAAVMCGRNYGYQLRADIDTQAQTASVNVGKMFENKFAGFMGNIKIHAVISGFFHFGVDCPGHNVARSQLRTFVIVGHETKAIRQTQQSTFTSQRFK